MKLLIIFCFISLSSYSQDFKPGYYKAGDTVTVSSVRWLSLKTGNRSAAPKQNTFWKNLDLVTMDELVKWVKELQAQLSGAKVLLLKGNYEIEETKDSVIAIPK